MVIKILTLCRLWIYELSQPLLDSIDSSEAAVLSSKAGCVLDLALGLCVGPGRPSSRQPQSRRPCNKSSGRVLCYQDQPRRRSGFETSTSTFARVTPALDDFQIYWLMVGNVLVCRPDINSSWRSGLSALRSLSRRLPLR